MGVLSIIVWAVVIGSYGTFMDYSY
jgi:hypothetical protein